MKSTLHRILYVPLTLVMLTHAVTVVTGCAPASTRTDGPAAVTVQPADTALLPTLLDSAAALYNQTDYLPSLRLAQQVERMAVALGDSSNWAEALSIQMNSYERLSLSDSAILVGSTLLRLDSIAGDPLSLSYDYSSLAAIYLGNHEPARAYDFILTAISTGEGTDDMSQRAMCLAMASEICTALGTYQEALSYIQQAYAIDSVQGNPVRLGRRLSQMGDVMVHLERYAEAEHCYLTAVSQLEAAGERHSLGITLRNLGNLCLHQLHQPEQAMQYLTRAAEVTSASGELRILADTYQLLVEASRHAAPDSLARYSELYVAAKDSLLRLEKMRALAEFDMRYQTSQAKSRLEEQSLSLLSWRQGGVALFLALVVLVTLLVVLIRWLRRSRQTQQALTLRLEDLEEQKRQFLVRLDSQKIAEPAAVADDGGEVAAVRPSQADLQFVEQVNAIICEQMEQADLSAEAIASRLCITSQQLRRRLQAILGVTAQAYITSVRLQFAQQLLAQDPPCSIAEVALRCGFGEPANFSRAFRQKTGLSPSQYRKTLQNN